MNKLIHHCAHNTENKAGNKQSVQMVDEVVLGLMMTWEIGIEMTDHTQS